MVEAAPLLVGGVVTRADLMTLFGWDEDEEDREVTRLLTHYGGDVVVTDDGALLYVFDELLERGSEDLAEAAPRRACDEPAEPAPFFDASRSATTAVLAVLLAPLAAAGIHPDVSVVPVRLTELGLDAAFVRIQLKASLWAALGLLALLALRAPGHRIRRQRERRHQQLLEHLRGLDRAPDGAPMEAPDTAMLARLGGELAPDAPEAPDEAGRLVVRFPDHARERAAAEALRAERADAPRRPADVVFDTASNEDHGP